MHTANNFVGVALAGQQSRPESSKMLCQSTTLLHHQRPSHLQNIKLRARRPPVPVQCEGRCGTPKRA